MVTTQQISDKLLLARAYYLELMANKYAEDIAGGKDYNNEQIKCIKRLIYALQPDTESEDYIDSDTEYLYERLSFEVSRYSGASLVVDPNVVVPGTTINTGGGTTLEINRTQADLLETSSGSGIWYLPMVDDDGNNIVPTSVFIIYNGLELPGKQLDTNYTPARVYGFPDNSEATIKATYTI